MCFEVVQEYAHSSSSSSFSGSSAAIAGAAAAAAAAAGAGGKGDSSMLGFVRLNLAEYVEVGNANTAEGGDGEVVRRYLMQGSKINSTLKVCPTLPLLPSFFLFFILTTSVYVRIHTSQHKLIHTSSDRNPHDPNRRRNKLHRVPNPPSPSPSFHSLLAITNQPPCPKQKTGPHSAPPPSSVA